MEMAVHEPQRFQTISSIGIGLQWDIQLNSFQGAFAMAIANCLREQKD